MRLPVKKCLAVFDTNIIYVSDEDGLYKFSPKDSFSNFWSWVISNSIDDICLFVIPDIIVNEIAKQKYDHNNSLRSKYYDCAKFFGIRTEIPEQKFEQNYVYIRGFIDALDIQVIPHPLSLENIINRAIHKRKPFLGKSGSSDKGFKDAVMLHSILEIENLSDFDKVFWLTKNGHDFTKDIEEEVDNLIIFNSEESIEKFKEYIVDNYAWQNKLIKFLETNKTEVLKYLYDSTGIQYLDFSYNVKDFIFDSVTNIIEFSINTVADDGNKLDFLLFFDINVNYLVEDPADSDEDEDTEGI